MKMTKYPSIEQFKSIIKQVKDSYNYIGLDENAEPMFDITMPLPILRFTGTVKAHGTNSGIGFDLHNEALYDEYWCQSRERIISPIDDNAGFATYVAFNISTFKKIFKNIENAVHEKFADSTNFTSVVIFGEWCGGNIQKGVGINSLPKMFLIFGIKLVALDDKNVWVDSSFIKDVIQNIPEANIYTIYTFGEYYIDIDFAKPEFAQNQLIETTIAIEEECPIAKYFGIDNGVGEGLVWHHSTTKGHHAFKTKGAKHSVSKVKTLVPIDIERVNSINECVDKLITENRLLQGLSYLSAMGLGVDVINTGPFIKWITSDVIKEELEVIIESGFEVKDVMGPVSKKAKTWFFQQL